VAASWRMVMMKASIAPALCFLSFLSACGQASSDQSAGNAAADASAATRHITIRNEYQENLLKLSDTQRDLTLRRAVRDDNGKCNHISGSKFQQDYKSMKMWVAHCDSGDWAVFLAPTGDVQVRSCQDIPKLNADNKWLNLPTCHPAPVDTLAPPPEPDWSEPAAPPQPAGKP
jgi:hypothetical protein